MDYLDWEKKSFWGPGKKRAWRPKEGFLKGRNGFKKEEGLWKEEGQRPGWG